MTPPRCRCGHDRQAHEHYRRGSDCATCGPQVCPRFRREPGRPGSLLALLARLGRRAGRRTGR